ncbi:MAG: type II toxin-antitoxin system HicB family antitoxin [Deltaproteobacteria bacterium]|nr:type II toxin-antitoxin system HicB family antitoxin [Deltaproteobacteria bacterium]
MKTYIFKAVVEPDENVWSAYCPALLQQGAATWGNTKEEALHNLEDVVKMVLESLLEHRELIPEGPTDQAQISIEPQVAVTL